MKTITLKTEDTFFEHVTELAKSLHLSKSELIRKAIREYEKHIKKEALRKQIEQASFNVRVSNSEVTLDMDNTITDGLEHV
ncbi:ribbon-helix-helix protein, CopG family [Sulfurimonas autotrophica]|uniref:CopG domain protein DNA-binding domain protein n=1 Tax=Sulfurimonas autotrophica (strain ATCC BAA-671 / DSM 16294 / JCM 11897 / OK10) TaxID=563040 RepID=E0UT74_SULAO|nr:ribbon-helix-helix protein, CopG family [Sulfurimonas autotrophica]ADN08177.1 CopG domain protein DNA-binding domain protein [Sulfurimonas autotrophica DSM 16294]